MASKTIAAQRLSSTDGWNRPLQYSVTSEGIIALKSLGADGKPGGDGKNADLSRSYRSKKSDGSLWVGWPMWIVEAEKTAPDAPSPSFLRKDGRRRGTGAFCVSQIP